MEWGKKVMKGFPKMNRGVCGGGEMVVSLRSFVFTSVWVLESRPSPVPGRPGRIA
jgi:hypothetical protein